MPRMIKITEHDEGARQVVWLHDVPEFQYPEALADYLQQAAQPGSYRISDNWDIWATPEALDAAVAALEAEGKS